MEFDVEKGILFTELQYVQGVVERKTTVPVLSNVLLEAEGNRLVITATDLDVSVRCSCPADIKQPGAWAISARKLVDMIRLLPDKPVHFETADQGLIRIECDRSNFRIAGLSKENFPEVPQVAGDTLSLPASALRYMITHSIFAVTQEESRYTLNGGLLLVNASGLTLVTSDGHRLAILEKPLESPPVDQEIRILVPKKTLVELSKMAEGADEVVFGHTENHLFFQMGERLLVSRLLVGQFPNYDLVIPKENKLQVVVRTDEFLGAVRRVQVMADEQSQGVELSASEGELRLSAKAEAGDAAESLPADYQGDPVKISFNATYLVDFLQTLSSEDVCLLLRDSDTQGLLIPKDSDGYTFRYVVMPMKV